MQIVIDELKKINDVISSSSTTYKSILNIYGDWDINETRELSKGVTSKKLFCDNTIVKFFVTIEPKRYLPPHWHDVKEICRVISGELKDEYNKVSKKEGEIYEIKALKMHSILNPSEDDYLFLIVEFKLK